MATIKKTIPFGNHQLTIETGQIARQATASVIVSLDDTVVLVTVVGLPEPKDAAGGLPLRVDYQERSYAAGKIPGGFFKREGRPSERETLICRLIDRPIRPLFPEGFNHEVQLIATVMSLNPQIDSDIPAMIGASAALALSGLPFNGPMGAARVGYANGQYLLNPTQLELDASELDLVVAGTSHSVLMVESEAHELSESVMLGAVMFGHQAFQPVIDMINALVGEAGKPDFDWKEPSQNTALVDEIKTIALEPLTKAYQIQDKQARYQALKLAKANVLDNHAGASESPDVKAEIKQILEDMSSQIVRGRILGNEPRIDGRDSKTVRPIQIHPGFLPRVHGSAVFTRGETQAIVVVTLGTARDAQVIDSPLGEYKDNFMLHYNFPPYSVGEVGAVGSPKRREIGHGMLAKRAIRAVLPKDEDFPYVLRAVSEITESNGSSSMATVCGTSLALMDAGVPVKSAVAGIAMGLIKEDNRFQVISDILGDEDHLGDMDFKVAGTEKGVTALQMDIKIDGITEEIMRIALDQAKAGRLHILNIMNEAISAPRQEMSSFAPQMMTFKIHPDKIREVIGKGGATIRSLTEGMDATVDIDDDGTVCVASSNKAAATEVKRRIDLIVAEAEVGKVYEGRVVRITEFGAFVNFLPGKDGLVHISQITDKRIADVNEVLQEGQVVKVKVLEIDKQGRVRLSMKEVATEDAS